MTDEIKLQTKDLTDDEIADLEGRGIDTSGPEVSIPQPTAKSDAAPKPPPGEEHKTIKKQVEAPPPSKDVVDRVKQRVANQEELEGSSFEHRDEDGNVVEQQGKVDGAGGVEPEPKEDPVDTQDRANFLAHVLGAPHFKKTYHLFGGKLLVTFQTRTANEDDACARQSWDDDRLQDFAGTSLEVRAQQRVQRYFDYQFVASLAELSVAGDTPRKFEPFKTEVRAENAEKLGWSPIRQAREDLYAELSQPMQVGLKALNGKFEKLVLRLVAEAESPDFWEAGSDT